MEPLVDSWGREIRSLRVSVTDKCNFRCRYCMPAEGLEWLGREEILSFEEIQRLVRLLAAMGVDEVRLTGGEPLVRRDLPVLVELLAGVEGVRDLSLTTNGVPTRSAGHRPRPCWCGDSRTRASPWATATGRRWARSSERSTGCRSPSRWRRRRRAESLDALARRLADDSSVVLAAAPPAGTGGRSLGAALDAAVDRLGPDARRLYPTLSVFPGSFDVRGAAGAAGTDRGDGGGGPPRGLADATLVQRSARGGGNRWRLLRPHPGAARVRPAGRRHGDRAPAPGRMVGLARGRARRRRPPVRPGHGHGPVRGRAADDPLGAAAPARPG